MDGFNNYNYKRKYILSKHIVSDKERKYSSGELKLLFAETNNRCCNCGKPLEWNIDGDIDSKKNQIAHIYGKKLFGSKGMPLDKKYHINSEQDINRYNNLIVMCDNCHKEYDKNPTYEKYVKILGYKEKASQLISTERFVYFNLEDILEKIKNGAFDRICISSNGYFPDYKKSKLAQKLDYNNISPLKKRSIMNHMVDYFSILHELIGEMDENIVLNKYKEVYIELEKIYSDRNEIIRLIDRSLYGPPEHMYNDLIPIITAFMIMNCEVLDNVAE